MSEQREKKKHRKHPWLTPEERILLESARKDTLNMLGRVRDPDRQKELEVHLRTLSRELAYDQ